MNEQATIKTVDSSLRELVQEKLNYLGMYFNMLVDGDSAGDQEYVGHALYQKVLDEVDRLLGYVEGQCGKIYVLQSAFSGSGGIEGLRNVGVRIGEPVCEDNENVGLSGKAN